MIGGVSSTYGACGIPYYVSDTVADVKELMSTPVGVIRDAHFFKKVPGIIVKTTTEVTRIEGCPSPLSQ